MSYMFNRGFAVFKNFGKSEEKIPLEMTFNNRQLIIITAYKPPVISNVWAKLFFEHEPIFTEYTFKAYKQYLKDHRHDFDTVLIVGELPEKYARVLSNHYITAYSYGLTIPQVYANEHHVFMLANVSPQIYNVLNLRPYAGSTLYFTVSGLTDLMVIMSFISGFKFIDHIVIVPYAETEQAMSQANAAASQTVSRLNSTGVKAELMKHTLLLIH